MAELALIAGLGNPGPEYAQTRHNVGFDVVDLLSAQHGIGPFRVRGQVLQARGEIDGQPAVLCKPQTYMNDSGPPLSALAHFYRLEVGALLVIHDELDFDAGIVRLKQGGGHGGHNGLRSIMAHLGGEFARIRLGVGKPPNPKAGAHYVLARPKGAEAEALQDAIAAAADAVRTVLRVGIVAAMNELNRPG